MLSDVMYDVGQVVSRYLAASPNDRLGRRVSSLLAIRIAAFSPDRSFCICRISTRPDSKLKMESDNQFFLSASLSPHCSLIALTTSRVSSSGPLSSNCPVAGSPSMINPRC